MKIIGGRVSSVEAKKHEGSNFSGLAMNIQIVDFKESGKSFHLYYNTTYTYNDDYAMLSIKGFVDVELDGKEKKRVMDEWEKKKQLPVEMAEELLPAINYTASAVGTLLAFTINVNAPINVPRSKIMPLPGEKAG